MLMVFGIMGELTMKIFKKRLYCYLQAYIKMVQDQKKACVQKRLDEYIEREKKDDTI